eukprot:3308544-Rhodomonas_salina.1
MAFMFAESAFTGDISKWDVSAVNSMEGMFHESSFTGDLCPWALENSPGVDQTEMFDLSPLD